MVTLMDRGVGEAADCDDENDGGSEAVRGGKRNITSRM